MTVHTRRGYQFEAEVHEGLKLAGLDVWKIPDSKAVGRVIPIRTPADFIYSNGKNIYTVEAKQTKLGRIPWSNFRDHQIEWCLANPDFAYFIINFNNRRLGVDKINETFIVTAADIILFQVRWPKSVPLQEFRDNCKQLYRLTPKYHPRNKCAYIDCEGVDL